MNRKWLGLSAILFGMSASAIMQTLVATSMPAITRELGGMELYAWVFSAYMLASTIAIPLFAQLSDTFGRRMFYIGGMLIFLLGSALIGASASMGWLVAFRALQGIGASAVAPAALASIGDLFTETERGKMFGVIGAVQVLANLIGPPLGGWVTDAYSWRLGFYLVIPLGLIALALAAFGLRDKRQTNAIRLQLDWLGALAIGFGLCAGLLSFQFFGAKHVTGGAIVACLSLALLFFAARWENKQPNPVIPMSMLNLPSVWKPVLGTLLLGLATNSAVVYFPLYLQNIFSQNATQTGFALLPILLMAGIASGAGGTLASRFPRQTQTAAWSLVLVGFSLLTIFHPQNILFMAALIGAGLGLLPPVFLHLAQSAGGAEHLATASGLIQMARNLGGAMGIPLLGAWLALGETNLSAFIAIFASLATVGALGLLLGFIEELTIRETSRRFS